MTGRKRDTPLAALLLGAVIIDHGRVSPIDPTQLSDVIDRYASWIGSRPDLTDAVCWTVARTEQHGTTAMRLLSPDWVIGDRVDLEQLAELSFSEPDATSGREHRGWLVETDSHVGVLEIGGFGGSVIDSVRAWSISFGATAGMFWNVNGVNQLLVGRRGEPETFEMLVGEPTGGLGPILSPYRTLLDEEGEPWATGLAIVEAEAGLALDETILGERWPVVEFASRLVAPEPPPGPGTDISARFARALEAADPAIVVETQALAAAATVDSTGIGDEPGVTAALAAIRCGRLLAPDTDDTEQFRQLAFRLTAEMQNSPFKAGDPANPAWRRYQSYAALSSFATGIRFKDGWLHVRNALDDTWPILQEQIVAMLTSRSR